MAAQLNILVADDEALVRQGLIALLEQDNYVFHEASTGEEAWHALQTGEFDLALVDIGLPLRSGLDVLHESVKRHLSTKIIVLTGDTTRHSPRDIYKLGAAGFLYKTDDAEQMLNLFDAVIAGRDTSSLLPSNEREIAAPAELMEQLTDREKQIVKLVVEGISNKKAANLLSISEHTVRKHREHINAKLQCGSPAALAALAIKAGLI